MPDMIDRIAYLSQEIGPRPAGTEEEQQAASYIAEAFKKNAGLDAEVEDFTGVPAHELPAVICCGASLFLTLLSMFVAPLRVPALIITVAAAAIFVAEAFGYPVISRFLGSGVSQNVVARFEPRHDPEQGPARRRKIVLVTRYDSGKVRSELSGGLAGAQRALNLVSLGAMVALAVLAFVRTVFLANGEGASMVVLNVLSVIAMLLAAIPIVVYILHQVAQYNEAANGSASGVAMIIELARRISREQTSYDAEDATMHGENALRASGLIPDGAVLSYDDAPVKEPPLAPQTEAERLAAAKAAIAALSGQPVTGAGVSNISGNLVNVKEPPVTYDPEESKAVRDETRDALSSIPENTVAEALQKAEASQPEEEYSQDVAAVTAQPTVSSYPVPVDDGIPDWFKKAQRNAKRPKDEGRPVQRSRYASALDAAVQESSGHFMQANAVVEHKLEEALSVGKEEIREVEPPEWAMASATAASQVQSAALQANPSSFFHQAASIDGDVFPEVIEQPETVVSDVNASQQTVADQSPVDSLSHEMIQQAQRQSDEPIQVSSPETPVVISGEAQPEQVARVGQGETAVSVEQIEHGMSTEQKKQPEQGSSGLLDGVIEQGQIEAIDEPRIAMPSFLDPVKVQQEAQAAQPNAPRTTDRVNVTVDPAATTGRISSSLRPAAQVKEPAKPHRRSIKLPDIAEKKEYEPVANAHKQRAPLAEAGSLSSRVPAVTNQGTAPDNRRQALRSLLPSLSAAIMPVEDQAKETLPEPVSKPVGLTGSFAPINEELLNNVDPDDIYVDDADDSAYDEDFTETGAFAGAGYVDMPTSRVSRFFGKLKPKSKERDTSAQEWLNVDEGFDARTVGKERGGWESFRQEDDAIPEVAQSNGEYEDGFEDDEYVEYDDGLGATTAFDPLADDADFEGFFEESEPVKKHRFPWQGGAFSADMLADTSTGDSGAQVAATMGFEVDEVRQFRNAGITTEVWFVALGAELEGNSGMKAFLNEHSQDLRGALIVNVDSIGAGDLCLIEREGSYRLARASSRMKRFLKKATQVTGVRTNTATIAFEDSAASVAIKNGCQAMHLAGMQNGKPALYAEAQDTVDAIDAELLDARANFLMEFIKAV
ncbi:M28 family peptidase [Adlercreutzia sp. ZJ141]|uniref:M28 family peptidase n=1 Tax=Adlercreutzia sp. ZJ141 TaxID=2709406 RepID=UPI0013E9F2BE|nr:M28 family peptidase [Adlercreutzia sp. ZJ141]